MNVNKYNNINIHRKLDVNKSTVSWKHNAIKRMTPYADRQSRQKYGQRLDGADRRPTGSLLRLLAKMLRRSPRSSAMTTATCCRLISSVLKRLTIFSMPGPVITPCYR
jgi:hypothetical protein